MEKSSYYTNRFFYLKLYPQLPLFLKQVIFCPKLLKTMARSSFYPIFSRTIMKKNDILVSAISPSQIRMVLHLDVSDEMVKKVIKVIENKL